MVHPDGAHSGLAIRNITVVGDTIFAQPILHALRELDPSRQLTLLTSSPTTQSPPSSTSTTSSSHQQHDHDHDHDHVRHLTADLSSPASLRAALAGQDLVISTEAGGNYAAQTRLVNAAVQARVPRFVPAEFGADSLNEGVQARLPPHAERARLIKFLRAMESEGSEPAPTSNGSSSSAGGCTSGGCCAHDDHHGHGHAAEEQEMEVQTSGGFHDPFSWVAVAAGTLLGEKLEDLGFDVKWQSATVYGSGGEAFAVSSLAWIGRLVARVVERWDSVKNNYLYAAGCVTTADEVVECLQKATGKEWSVGKVAVEECVKEGEKCLQRGFPDAGIALMERSVLYDTSLGAVDSFKTKSANDVLGLGQEKVEDIVSSAVHDFQHHGKADCGCS
ncbi:hypothetical protein DIS24_g6830 [Lasiodiplodia hormozganensis]|uniref:NmrA-like domain-containing protein n=1 Tax=Lasiodiplodia hormozganensis TaxID=869390 RepID=A0AA39YFZ5_9PEZI|nr:hypothetical protein DIS24_g6830 [Lasiodiplodia hormozganensis]